MSFNQGGHACAEEVRGASRTGGPPVGQHLLERPEETPAGLWLPECQIDVRVC